MSNIKRTQSDAELGDVDTLTKKVKELEDEIEGLKDDKEGLTLEIKDLKDNESELEGVLKNVSDRVEGWMDDIVEGTKEVKRDIKLYMVGISFN
jgi:predicted  nucleic acid-binding Zn-ribbon protein